MINGLYGKINNKNMSRIIICLTPVKNESWILDRFLSLTSLWADYIIIANQNSTDKSKEIAKKYSKVILIENNSKYFNEPERQKMLLDESRKIEGEKIIFTLDADEILTSNYFNSPEWDTVINAKIGTVIYFEWMNIKPDLKTMWSGGFMPLAFIDDGSEHCGEMIHSPRIPLPKNANSIRLNDIKIMHFQYTDWNRMKMKQRWYQCYEKINKKNINNIDIYRMYHHMDVIPKDKINNIPKEWFQGYIDINIDLTSVNVDNLYYWERDILDYLLKYGLDYFKYIDIWDIKWEKIAEKWGFENVELFIMKKDIFMKILKIYLQKTQKIYNNKFIKIIDYLLKNILT